MSKRGPQLTTIRDVSKFLGRLIRESYMGQLDPAKAAKLAYMCNLLKGCLEASDVEKRIEELEAKLAGKEIR